MRNVMDHLVSTKAVESVNSSAIAMIEQRIRAIAISSERGHTSAADAERDPERSCATT